jgi:hypothetical protein
MTNLRRYAGNQGDNAANEDRDPSPFIWNDCPWEDISSGALPGYARHWEFDGFRTSANINAAEAYWSEGLKAFGSNGAAITAVDQLFGAVSLGSDGDDEGASIAQFGQPCQIDQGQGKFWLEARIKTSTVADTKHGIFFGMCDSTALTATVPLTAAGALADLNLVGFLRAEGDGDQLDCVYKANGVTAVTVQADALPSAYVLAADTYIKIGLKYFADADYTLKYFANGVSLASKAIPSADGTDFPNDVRLGWVLAVLNATGSTPGTTTVDWVRVAQLAA